MAQQTAVEWLQVQLNEKGKLSAVDFYQAEVMEKKQSLELIKLASQLTGVATVDEEIAKMEYIDVYNQYYNKIFAGQGSPDTTTPPNTQNK